MFIVIEGGDASGKTTICESLGSYLRDQQIDHQVTREPGGTMMGEYIRPVFINPLVKLDGVTELLLLGAMRRQHLQETILPALDAGKVVVCSRFTASTHAFQGAAGVDVHTIDNIMAEAMGDYRQPDLTILLDVPVEVALERMTNRGELDRIESKGPEYHQHVRDLFLEYAHGNPEEVVVIDASQPLDEVRKQVFATVMERRG